MIDELRQIYIFAKTVDHGSFRAAAQTLRLSPSVVSHHVGQLEERLGTALLYRSTRKLSLTSDGERLLVAAHAMIEAVEAGVQDIAQQTEQVSGVLKMTVPAVLGQSSLTDQFAAFALANPKVRLDIFYSDARQDLIANGFDVAIRIGKLKDSSLKARKLFDIKRRLVAAPAYIKTQTKPTKPKDLSDWDWIELAPIWKQKRVFKNAGKSVTLSYLTSRVSVNDVYAMSHLARSGAGLAVIPEFIAEHYVRAGDLKYVLPNWSLDPVTVSAVWPANAPKGGLIKLFISFLNDTAKAKYI